MSASLAPAPTERIDEELTFDPGSGRLALGVFDVSVPPGSANGVVLDAYVDLVAQRRGYRPAAPVEVRSDDIGVLAGILDLDAVDIDELIAEILGAEPEAARGLTDRLRARKLAIGVAAAATGLFVLGSVGLAGRNSERPAPAAPPVTSTTTAPPSTTAAVITTTTVAVPRPPITESPDGVGLVEPIQQDGSGVGLAPAETDSAG